MTQRLSAQQEFERESMRFHGRYLKGRYAHWCEDWDELPIDETCMEFCACTCYSGSSVDGIQEKLRAERSADETATHPPKLWSKDEGEG